MRGLELDSKLNLSLVDKTDRQPRDREVIVRVVSSGICGTDNHIIKGESRVTLPVVLGHEFGGFVQDVGKSVRSLKRGDLVVVDPNIPCHSCAYCREGKFNLCSNLTAIGVDIDGGMSDLCIVPETQAYPVASSFDPTELPFVEPLSCVLHGLDRAAVRSGERVLVIGTGTIGLMFVMLLKEVAAELCIDEPNPVRSGKAATLGGRIKGADRSEYFDVVVECSGTVTGFADAIARVKRGGRVLVFGVAPRKAAASVWPNEIYARELTILGSYVNPSTFSRAVEIVSNKKISLSSFDVKAYKLNEFNDAFEASRSGRYSKVMFSLEERGLD